MSKIEGLSQREYESRVADLLEDAEFMGEFATMIRTAYKTGHAFPDWAQVLETQVHDRIADDMAEDERAARLGSEDSWEGIA